MAWTKFQLALAATMLVTGSINTISTKWADKLLAPGIEPNATANSTQIARPFNHPFLQAVGMFLGELSCLLVFHLARLYTRIRSSSMDLGNQSFNPLIFLPAALCDMLGTSTMYVGLNLTFASSFQMLRGAVMIFTALFSKIFLRRVIKAHMWLGIFVVVCGLVAVGVADMVFSNEDKSDKNNILYGDMLIIAAQVITAVQMVYEEKFVVKHNVPALQAVGWEGFFGVIVLGILLVPMYYIKIGQPFSNDPEGRMENALDAFVQMGNNPLIIVAVVGNIVSIAFFNFSGISVTKELSATTRMVLDSARTLVIWVFSLLPFIAWQIFFWKEFLCQAAGFILLISGMCLYNDIIFSPLLRKVSCLNPDRGARSGSVTETEPCMNDAAGERSPLLNEDRPALYDPEV